jgi:hypothetical protein
MSAKFSIISNAKEGSLGMQLGVSRVVRFFSAAAVVGAIGLGVIGCGDKVKAPPAGKRDLLSPDAYPRNVVTDKLDKAIVFGEPAVDEATDKKPMRVLQPVRNTANYGVSIQYQFEFFDSTGRPLTKTQQGWRYARLESRVEKFLEATALDANAADWRLVVRSAR